MRLVYGLMCGLAMAAFSLAPAATTLAQDDDESTDPRIEKLEQEIDAMAEKLGGRFEEMAEQHSKKLDQWAEEYGKHWEKWGEEFEKHMQQWADEHQEEIQNWAQQYAEQWEKWGKEFADQNMSSEDIEKIVGQNLKMLNKLPLDKIVKDTLDADLNSKNVSGVGRLEALDRLKNLYEEGAVKQLELAEAQAAKGDAADAQQAVGQLKESIQKLQQGLDAKREKLAKIAELRAVELEKSLKQKSKRKADDDAADEDRDENENTQKAREYLRAQRT